MDRPRQTGAVLRPGSITLARHGQPDADRTVRLNAEGYRQWWADYDTIGLRPGDQPPPEVVEAARRADIILCSGLPRAMVPARAAAPGRDIAIEPVFIEAPLPPPPLPGFLLMKPPAWGALSRIAWWLGYGPEVESRMEAERRAEQGAGLLVEAARGGAHVMLFAHGWFNRMLRPALRRRGYLCAQDGGDYYWSFRVYEPRGFAPAAPADRVDGGQERG